MMTRMRSVSVVLAIFVSSRGLEKTLTLAQEHRQDERKLTDIECSLCPPESRLENRDLFIPEFGETCRDLESAAEDDVTTEEECLAIQRYAPACCRDEAECFLCEDEKDPRSPDRIVYSEEGSPDCQFYYVETFMAVEDQCDAVRFLDGTFDIPAYCRCRRAGGPDSACGALCGDADLIDSNTVTGYGGATCEELELFTEYILDESLCDEVFQYRSACCEAEETPSPTIPPSSEPTMEPTTEPTIETTTEPTIEPTIETTTEPTIETTTEPTIETTTEPTIEPTIETTTEPTIETTTEPTLEGEPTTPAPSSDTTAPPTPTPTSEGTVAATSEGTVAATAPPTAIPTESLSTAPTATPTDSMAPTTTTPMPTPAATMVVSSTPAPTPGQGVPTTAVPTTAPVVPTEGTAQPSPGVCQVCPADAGTQNRNVEIPEFGLDCADLVAETDPDLCEAYKAYAPVCCEGVAECSLCADGARPPQSDRNKVVFWDGLTCNSYFLDLYQAPADTCASQVTLNGVFDLASYCGCPEAEGGDPADVCGDFCAGGYVEDADVETEFNGATCGELDQFVLHVLDEPSCSEVLQYQGACCTAATPPPTVSPTRSPQPTSSPAPSSTPTRSPTLNPVPPTSSPSGSPTQSPAPTSSPAPVGSRDLDSGSGRARALQAAAASVVLAVLVTAIL